jgi:beta-glucosidase
MIVKQSIGYAVNFGWQTFDGTLITAGGSGGNTPPYVISPFKAIQDRVIADGGILRWDFVGQAPTTYPNADACLVFINAYASEAADRTTLADEWSDKLVQNVATNCSNTIVIIHSAGTRLVDAWIDHPNITAVIFAGLPGQESGHGLVDILYGDVNPSGRLPYTVARSESDYGHLLNSTIDSSAFPQSNFTERLYIDYRRFDAEKITPRYEFGFGLSYTTFGFSNLSIIPVEGPSTSKYPSADVKIVQGGHPELWDVLYVVQANITNNGTREGAEIAQLYLGIPNSPARQLRGFDKVGPLTVNEVGQAVFEIKRRDLSVWNVESQDWELQRGVYNVWVGSSSRKLHLESTIEI